MQYLLLLSMFSPLVWRSCFQSQYKLISLISINHNFPFFLPKMMCRVTWEVVVQSDNGALACVDLTLVGSLMMWAGWRDGIQPVCACSHFFKLIHLLGFHLSMNKFLQMLQAGIMYANMHQCKDKFNMTTKKVSEEEFLSFRKLRVERCNSHVCSLC